MITCTGARLRAFMAFALLAFFGATAPALALSTPEPDERITHPRNHIAYDHGTGWNDAIHTNIQFDPAPGMAGNLFTTCGFGQGTKVWHTQSVARLPNKDGRAYFAVAQSYARGGWVSVLPTLDRERHAPLARPVLGEHAVDLLFQAHDDGQRQVPYEVPLGQRVTEDDERNAVCARRVEIDEVHGPACAPDGLANGREESQLLAILAVELGLRRPRVEPRHGPLVPLTVQVFRVVAEPLTHRRHVAGEGDHLAAHGHVAAGEALEHAPRRAHAAELVAVNATYGDERGPGLAAQHTAKLALFREIGGETRREIVRSRVRFRHAAHPLLLRRGCSDAGSTCPT